MATKFSATGSGTTTITTAETSDRTVTMPNATDTLVGKATTCTCAMAFAASNAPTSIGYNVISCIQAAADGAPVAPVMTWVDQVATTVVTATSTAGWAIKFRGILRTNLATTITPQVNWSAN